MPLKVKFKREEKGSKVDRICKERREREACFQATGCQEAIQELARGFERQAGAAQKRAQAIKGYC